MLNKPTPVSHTDGFTLVELLTVISIVAILAAVAMPGFRSTIAANAVSNAASTLSADLSFARSEAVKRGVSVTMCSSTDASTCADSATWQAGWVVFLDRNADDSRSTTGSDGEDLLRVQQEVSGKMTISSASATAVSKIRFDRTGRTSGAGLKVVSTINDSTTDRAICVATTGRALIKAQGVNAC
jgi:type IV fimbrial biogenesis protein FimT